MNKNRHTSAIEELSASEGVFTTAQAERLGIPRNAIAKACEAGRLVRVAHGAYRMAGVPASVTSAHVSPESRRSKMA